jgi:hypothetical protein
MQNFKIVRIKKSRKENFYYAYIFIKSHLSDLSELPHEEEEALQHIKIPKAIYKQF